MDDLKGLERRVSRGFDILREMEDSGNTGEKYDYYFTEWKNLLEKYEAELTAQGRKEA